MSPDFDGLVETSTSLGEAITEGDTLTLHSLSRSSNDSALPDVIGALDAAARLAGGTLEVKHNYGGWRPDLDSPALAAARAGLRAAVRRAADRHRRPRRARDGGHRRQGRGARHDLVRAADRGAAFARRAGEHPDGRALLAAAGRRSSTRSRSPEVKLEANACNRRRGDPRLIVLWGSAPRPATAATTPARRFAPKWADDVCGTVGAWEGQLKDIREDLRHNNWAARRSDGSTGDSQEQVVTVHDAVDRAMRATQETLQEGLKRAGIPDVRPGRAGVGDRPPMGGADRAQPPPRQGADQAAPTSVSEAFASLVPPITALARSAVDGRAAFAKVEALDPELEDAFSRSGTCRRLLEKKP